MDDSGNPPEKLLDDNAYVLDPVQAGATYPEFRIPLSLVEYVKKPRQEAMSRAELKMVTRGVSQPPLV